MEKEPLLTIKSDFPEQNTEQYKTNEDLYTNSSIFSKMIFNWCLSILKVMIELNSACKENVIENRLSW